MRRSGLVVAVLAAAVVSAVTHALALGWFVVGTCGVSDTADSFPAVASLQGLVCDSGQSDHWLSGLGYVVLATSALMAPVVAGFAWRRGGAGRWVAALAPVVLPVLTLAVLSLPPDTCGDEARRTHPAYDCRTAP